MSTTGRVSVLVLVVGLTACGASRTGMPVERAPETGAEDVASRYSVPRYSVHEWGLVRGGEGDTLEAGTIGPGVALSTRVVLKPVLYFHLADEDVSITSARVRAVEGVIREHFPVTTPGTPSAVDWGALEVVRGACATPFVAPTASEPPCSGLSAGEMCEAATLDTVVAADADCVMRGGVATPFLFYRSSTRGLTVPLRAVRLPNGDLEITNDGDLSIPGRIVRIQRDTAGERIAVVTPPAPHTSITIPATASGDDGVTAISTTLAELGLTTEESAAFHRAWDPTFFEGPGGMLDLSLTIPIPDESIVYFLPPALAEHIATIELEPPPTEIRRAMAVWTAVGPGEADRAP